MNIAGKYLTGATRYEGEEIRLVSGIPGQVGTIFRTKPVNFTNGFSLSFKFRMQNYTRYGGMFSLQNTTGFSPAIIPNNPNGLGWSLGSYIHVPFRVDNGISNWGLHIGAYNGIGHTEQANVQTYASPTLPNFNSNHLFQIDLNYNPSLSQATLSLTDHAASLFCMKLYANITLWPTLFELSGSNTPGNQAYAGFTGVTGPDTGSIWISDWSQSDDPIIQSTARIVIPEGAEARVCGGLFSVGGKLLRSLFGNLWLKPGTYTADSDGKDEANNNLPDAYDFKYAIDTITSTNRLIGNNNATSDYTTSLGAPDYRDCQVSPDGSTIVIADTSIDSGIQGAIVLLNPATGVVRAESVVASGGSTSGMCVAVDNDYFWHMQHNWMFDATLPWEIWITRQSNTAIGSGYYQQVGVPLGFTGTVNTVNPNGSKIVAKNVLINTTVLRIFSAATPAPGGYFGRIPFPSMAVSSTSLWVCDQEGNNLTEYNKLTAIQVSTPISIPFCTGVCVLANGHIAVAHASISGGTAANRLSVYNGHTLIRTMSEITVTDVSKIAAANGKLVVADNAFGIKTVKVYSISGDTATLLFSFMGPATWGDDDGINQAWHLISVSIDNNGNIYTGQRPLAFAPGGEGCQVVKRNSSGVVQWVKDAHGYRASLPGPPDGLPGTYITSTLKKFKSSGDYAGIAGDKGFAAFGSDAINRWSNSGDGTVTTSPRWVNINGLSFCSLSVSYPNRLIIKKHIGNGNVKTAAAIYAAHFDTGKFSTWHDALNDGYPLDNQIVQSDRIIPNIAQANFQLGPDAAIWFNCDTTIWRMPLNSVDPYGNPKYDPSQAAIFSTPASGGYTGLTGVNLSVATDFAYLIGENTSIAPATSSYVIYPYTQGGSHTLTCLSLSGQYQWSIRLPEFCSTVTALPGYVAVGGTSTGRLHIYDNKGLHRITLIHPSTSDYYDFTGAVGGWRIPNGPMMYGVEALAASAFGLFTVDDSIESIVHSVRAINGSIANFPDVNPPIVIEVALPARTKWWPNLIIKLK